MKQTFKNPKLGTNGPDNISTVSSDDEMGVRHCFYDFCKQTILHGWHYLADLEHEPTPSPSFVTFTPVSSPAVLEKRQAEFYCFSCVLLSFHLSKD